MTWSYVTQFSPGVSSPSQSDPLILVSIILSAFWYCRGKEPRAHGTERVNAGTRMGEQAFQLLMARAGYWGEQSLPLEKVDSILLAQFPGRACLGSRTSSLAPDMHISTPFL